MITPPPIIIAAAANGIFIACIVVACLSPIASARGSFQPPGPDAPALWPWPQHVDFGDGRAIPIDLDAFQLTCEVDNPCPIAMAEVLDYYTNHIKTSCNHPIPRNQQRESSSSSSSARRRGRTMAAADEEDEQAVSIDAITTCVTKLNTASDNLTIDTNVTYEVIVSGSPFTYCQINADNMYGAIYAFQTIAQLCDTGGASDGWAQAILEANVTDFPRFPYRGFLIDTSRHFLPLDYIKRIIDAISMHRYNVLHWHIVDSQSFPCGSDRFPLLSQQGAWHPLAIYQPEDMRALVSYAKSRGVTIVPEFDVPGHGSWGAAYPTLMGCPTVLDPTQNATYDLLGNFLEEMVTIFPSEYIFLGGDEVNSSCWQENPTIAKWMQMQGMTHDQLFDYFWQQVAVRVVPRLGGRRVGVWESDALDVNPALLPAGSFGNVWQHPKAMIPITDTGMPVVLSGPYYLDQENPVTDDGPCSQYAWQETWRCMYGVEPLEGLNSTQAALVMGGEAAMWGEGVNHFSFETRVWPKASAVAERLWSAMGMNDAEAAKPRLMGHVCRLNHFGIRASPIGPGFCITDLIFPFH